MPLKTLERGRWIWTPTRWHAVPSTVFTACDWSPPTICAAISGLESITGMVIVTVTSPTVPVAWTGVVATHAEPAGKLEQGEVAVVGSILRLRNAMSHASAHAVAGAVVVPVRSSAAAVAAASAAPRSARRSDLSIAMSTTMAHMVMRPTTARVAMTSTAPRSSRAPRCSRLMRLRTW